MAKPQLRAYLLGGPLNGTTRPLPHAVGTLAIAIANRPSLNDYRASNGYLIPAGHNTALYDRLLAPGPYDFTDADYVYQHRETTPDEPRPADGSLVGLAGDVEEWIDRGGYDLVELRAILHRHTEGKF